LKRLQAGGFLLSKGVTDDPVWVNTALTTRARELQL
jgi:hypothetical protein